MPVLYCLVVDDDADDRDFFEIALQDCGQPFHYTPVNSGTRALELLEEGSTVPDFIFLDLNMPLLSGKECLQIIRDRQHLQQVPVIIYSTSSYHKDIEETQQLGATHFLTKSADIDVLTGILNDIFSGRELPYLLA